MSEISFFREFRNRDQFRIDYPYYGLFGSANIKPLTTNDELVYQCTLLNGSEVMLKKLSPTKKWIDARLNRETPLSAIIGSAIDDFLKESQPGA